MYKIYRSFATGHLRLSCFDPKDLPYHYIFIHVSFENIDDARNYVETH
jgi:hypothetical protein